MKIYITRHGQTDWNKIKKIQGRTDIELNEEGRAQALETALNLKDVNFDVIFTSPLKRAVETAEIINMHHQVSILKDERIIERSFGDLEGASIHEIDFTNFWREGYDDLYPNSEPTKSFYERTQNFIKEMMKSDYNAILVVAHGGVSLPFYTFFNGMPQEDDMRKYMLNNCEVAIYDTAMLES